ncbi:MAG: hypothetical protein GX621_03830 [Pirellulaceae bacterium]|nr:hypothetical protein [Pirellulaceae bacterium]
MKRNRYFLMCDHRVGKGNVDEGLDVLATMEDLSEEEAKQIRVLLDRENEKLHYSMEFFLDMDKDSRSPESLLYAYEANLVQRRAEAAEHANADSAYRMVRMVLFCMEQIRADRKNTEEKSGRDSQAAENILPSDTRHSPVPTRTTTPEGDLACDSSLDQPDWCNAVLPVNDSAPPPRPRLVVDVEKNVVHMDGATFTVSSEQARFLEYLVKANGNWCSSTEMNIPKTDRLKKDLPSKEMRDLIISKPGKGSCIPRKSLWHS